MRKSEAAMRIATKMPALAKGALRLWVNIRISLGQKPRPEDHWFVPHLANFLGYRLPVSARLGNGMKMKVPWNDGVGGEIFRSGYYEKDIVRLFERLLKHG